MESGKAAASPYECEKVHEIDIISIASYHRRDFDLAVARTNRRDHEKVRSSLLRTISTTSSTLGNLQSLPLEIVYEICFLLDIRSLLNFRHANRRAQQIVRVTRGYEATITHALEAFTLYEGLSSLRLLWWLYFPSLIYEVLFFLYSGRFASLNLTCSEKKRQIEPGQPI
ncbi:Cyclin-like F-box [Penicillium digitatum]|uniref:Cyclin-like F-box n=1 Tax=Penicillium digitatum TaxID=36651 RepID=A0A7T6XL05_PENDI|nr:Cyclin-like F-box [Penicillium digitatum]